LYTPCEPWKEKARKWQGPKIFALINLQNFVDVFIHKNFYEILDYCGIILSPNERKGPQAQVCGIA